MGSIQSYPTSTGDFDQREVMEYEIKDENGKSVWTGNTRYQFNIELMTCMKKYAEKCDKDAGWIGSTITAVRYFDSGRKDFDFYLIKLSESKSKSDDIDCKCVASILALRKTEAGEKGEKCLQQNCYEKKSLSFDYASQNAVKFIRTKTF